MISRNRHLQSRQTCHGRLGGSSRAFGSSPPGAAGALEELATLYGVQTSYRDTRGRWCASPSESVVKVLRALGAELNEEALHIGQARQRLDAAVRARKHELWNRTLEPVVVAWDGVPPPLLIRLPERSRVLGRAGLRLTLAHEEGEEEKWLIGRDSLEVVDSETLGDRRFVACRVPGVFTGRGHRTSGKETTPDTKREHLPFGYHRLRLELGAVTAETVVISAPRRCWAPGADLSDEKDMRRSSGLPPGNSTTPLDVLGRRPWALFAPLYALRSERNWGAGDLADLEELRGQTAAQGGCAISTLPLLAGFLDDPFEPAPYRPVSRIFWNEFYLAVERISEWHRCPAAREFWSAADTQALVHELRSSPLVDYRGVMCLKRKVLEKLTDSFFSDPGPGRRDAFTCYLQAKPLVREYAAFRAERERHQVQERVTAAVRYHLFCQWQMDEQLGRLSGSADGSDLLGVGIAFGSWPGAESGLKRSMPGLFLDLPVGCHPDGFDTWRWPDLFVTGMCAGAPPDSFFSRGQNWDSPPLHPTRIRDGGHQYFVQCLRNHMRHADYLRIDHVTSLHRLFWVPEGAQAVDGVYVSYPAEEQYAVLCLESCRNRTVVVGEDLGTVPPGVRSAMRRHGLLRTWVFQAALRPRAREMIAAVPVGAVAGLNTHDMFPFAGFLKGDDITARVETGQLDESGAHRERLARRRVVERLAGFLETSMPDGGGSDDGLLKRALAFLAASPAELVVVNLEDLLFETKPQNLPGTGIERPNWRRKVKMPTPETIGDSVARPRLD